MSLEYVGLLSIYAFVIWGLLVGSGSGGGDKSVVQNSFSIATPVLGARIEKRLATGYKFSRGTKPAVQWETF